MRTIKVVTSTDKHTMQDGVSTWENIIDFYQADGWTVREDRVLAVYMNMQSPEGVPGARRLQVIAQYNQDAWESVAQMDSPEVAE